MARRRSTKDEKSGMKELYQTMARAATVKKGTGPLTGPVPAIGDYCSLSPVLGGEGSGVRGLNQPYTSPHPSPLPRVQGRGSKCMDISLWDYSTTQVSPLLNKASRSPSPCFLMAASTWALTPWS